MTNHSENTKSATCDNNVLANRLYKFRGVNKSNNEIIYGNYYFDGKYHFIDKSFEHRKEVYAKSVSQFTGLKDIEGKEIYEGDIILGYNNPHVVTFADGAFYLTYKNSSVRLSITCGSLKIIGNIFENPELTQTTS